MAQLTDEADWLRRAFDDLERAESTSLASLLTPVTRPAAHPVRSVVAAVGAFGFVLAASLLLGRPRA